MKIGKALRGDDTRWLAIWLAGLALVWLWLIFFLNAPALAQLRAAFLTTLASGFLVVIFSLFAGWGSALALDTLERRARPFGAAAVLFTLNLLRSVPQIIGILLGLTGLTILIERDVPLSATAHIVLGAAIIAAFLFLQVHDLIRERIAHFRRSDFYDATLCCGVRERRIINSDILARNSAAHLIASAITLFGSAIFLKCSADFIVSVGLSNEVNPGNFPATLGSLLATMDSKQDILAIGTAMADPSYVPALFVTHLQGIATAFIIIFTLLCLHRIAEGFVERHRL